MQFYFWNVTNANDVINNGAKPNVALAGPYSYLEKRIKWGIEWSNNSEVMTYRYNRTFTWVWRDSTQSYLGCSRMLLTIELLPILSDMLNPSRIFYNYINFISALTYTRMYRYISTPCTVIGTQDACSFPENDVITSINPALIAAISSLESLVGVAWYFSWNERSKVCWNQGIITCVHAMTPDEVTLSMLECLWVILP